MINVPNNENLLGGFSWPNFDNLYKQVIDGSFAAFARLIVLHLMPIQTPDSGLLAAPQPTQYNPLLGQAPRGVPNIVSTTRNKAVKITPRDVVYQAHIKHGPAEIDDKNLIRLEMDQCATTTVYESFQHITEAESVTIDGMRFKLHKSPRPIGLHAKQYLITIWQKIPEMQEGSQIGPP